MHLKEIIMRSGKRGRKIIYGKLNRGELIDVPVFRHGSHRWKCTQRRIWPRQREDSASRREKVFVMITAWQKNSFLCSNEYE